MCGSVRFANLAPAPIYSWVRPRQDDKSLRGHVTDSFKKNHSDSLVPQYIEGKRIFFSGKYFVRKKIAKLAVEAAKVGLFKKIHSRYGLVCKAVV